MRVLLTGGAGYIGAHTAVALAQAGHDVLVVDNLVNSSSEAIERVEAITGASIPLLVADARDVDATTAFVRQHAPVNAVIHFASLKSVVDSLLNPVEYYAVNLGSALAVLELMRRSNIDALVFSSSATVYGDDQPMPVTEDAPTPLTLPNPYGKTKQMIEEILRDAAHADESLRIVALRYFNPVGAHPSGTIGENPQNRPTNILPVISRVAAGIEPEVTVFGDYPTPDGTGLRDYIHVVDVAEGHTAALSYQHPGFHAFNLGTGTPVSVLELVATFSHASGREIATRITGRRPGDVAVSYADPSRAYRELGWAAERTLRQACVDAWRWQMQNLTDQATRHQASAGPQ